jgi:hypothetical protein
VAHPLLDRRDLTAQREAARAGAPAQPGPPELGGLAGEIAEYNRLLHELVRQERADIQQICVTDREPAQADMRDFPARGARRAIVRRTGSGGLLTLAAGAPTQVVDGNEARLGGAIVVSGAGAVILYLTSDLLTPGGGAPLGEGAPQIWLAGNGGAWDFRPDLRRGGLAR